MDKDSFKKLLSEAKRGLSVPTIPSWAKGTEIERLILRNRISAQPDIEKALLEKMKAAPEFELFNGKMFNQGRSASRVGVNDNRKLTTCDYRILTTLN